MSYTRLYKHHIIYTLFICYLGNLQPVKIKMDLNILLVNTNSFRHTRDLVARVKERLQAYPEIIHPILKAVDGISNKFLTLVQNLGEDENEKYFFKVRTFV